MTKLTGSSLPIARHCGWSFRSDVSYPEAKPISGDEADATRGTSKHDALAELVDHGVLPPVQPGVAVSLNHAARWWEAERRPGTGYRAEVAYAIDTLAPPGGQVVRELGKRLERAYGELRPGEVALTVDYERHAAGERRVVIGDFKGVDPNVEHPSDNLQLLAGAVCAMILYEAEEVQVEIARVTDEGCFVSTHVASAVELWGVLGEIRSIVNRIPTEEAKPGPHCRYCRALGACPATNGAIEAVAGNEVGLGVRPNWTTEFLSVENDAAMVMGLSHVKKALEAIEGALKARAGTSGIPLPNGKVYRASLQSRTGLDKEKVEHFLGARLSEFQKTTEFEVFRQVKP